MSLKKYSVVLIALTFLCGCESPKAAEPEKAAVNKASKEVRKGNTVSVSEPP